MAKRRGVDALGTVLVCPSVIVLGSECPNLAGQRWAPRPRLPAKFGRALIPTILYHKGGLRDAGGGEARADPYDSGGADGADGGIELQEGGGAGDGFRIYRRLRVLRNSAARRLRVLRNAAARDGEH